MISQDEKNQKIIHNLREEIVALENQLGHTRKLIREFGVLALERGDTDNQIALAAAWSLIKRTPVKVNHHAVRTLQVEGSDSDMVGLWTIRIERTGGES